MVLQNKVKMHLSLLRQDTFEFDQGRNAGYLISKDSDTVFVWEEGIIHI